MLQPYPEYQQYKEYFKNTLDLDYSAQLGSGVLKNVEVLGDYTTNGGSLYTVFLVTIAGKKCVLASKDYNQYESSRYEMNLSTVIEN